MLHVKPAQKLLIVVMNKTVTVTVTVQSVRCKFWRTFSSDLDLALILLENRGWILAETWGKVRQTGALDIGNAGNRRTKATGSLVLSVQL